MKFLSKAMPSRAEIFRPALVPIPPGRFLMGGITEDRFASAVEFPRHEIIFSEPFALGKYPVTRGEWSRIKGSPDPTENADFPITGITCEEIDFYLGELSRIEGIHFRLPSEAEWEYACRAGSETVFPNGSTLSPNEANFFYDEGGVQVGAGRPLPVGSFPPNAFGLHDMLGNVCEWTANLWHTNFQGAPADGSAWISGGKSGYRAIRGGAWDHLPRVLRASWRDWAPENARWDNLGFRLAASIESS